MTSINGSLTSDLLFNIFKRLDGIETTRIRRVCKQWFEIIDEHQSFWRTLRLPEQSLKWDSSILQLFDQKSGSTLQDVDIGVEVGDEHQEQIVNTLKKSRQSLQHLFLRFGDLVGTVEWDLLQSLSVLDSLRVIGWYDSGRIRLRRASIKSDSQEDGSNTASPLKVLWHHGAGRSILEITSDRFNNLISLDIGSIFSSSEWRKFLEGPSKSLKHLRLGFRNGKHEDHSGVSALYLPNLEVLELDDRGDFPQWLLIPDSLKLISHREVFNIPSISELWSWFPHAQRDEIANRLPKLKTLCLCYIYDQNRIVQILTERKANVEAGLHVDGVKMEMIKTLVLPFALSGPEFSDQLKQYVKKCGGLVQVVEGNARSRFIEVEY